MTEDYYNKMVRVNGHVTYYVCGWVDQSDIEDGETTAEFLQETIEHHPTGREPLTPID